MQHDWPTKHPFEIECESVRQANAAHQVYKRSVETECESELFRQATAARKAYKRSLETECNWAVGLFKSEVHVLITLSSLLA